jgi:mannose-6-phosphate isomerase-like protein (cupin superfamily)
MSLFATLHLAAAPPMAAPDGSSVRRLLDLPGGSMAHFALAPGQVSRAVAHRSVEEVWYVLGGRGEMWRKQGAREEIVTLEPGVCVTIPLGTHFQFRAFPAEPVMAVAVTLPPWPGDSEAVPVTGRWVVT